MVEFIGGYFTRYRVLLCMFHVVKAVKTRIARANQPTTVKQQMLAAFRRCLYSFTKDTFEERWRVLLDLLENGSEDLTEYFEEYWRPVTAKWVMYTRKNLKTSGNTTNNRMERFYLQFKLTLAERRRIVPRLTECIRVFKELMDRKASTATCMAYLQGTTQLRIYNDDHQELFDVVGKRLIDFAAILVRIDMIRRDRQMKHFLI